VLPFKADVSKAEDVKALADRTIQEFGAVHIVCNNAGVSSGGGLTWERTLADWQWVMGVNLWGVIHGVMTFLPIMVKQEDEGHIVNTASMAGLISGPFLSIYGVTKHAVVSLSESLYHELKMSGSKVGISVLGPGWVNTKILDAGRNRPEELANTPEQDATVPGSEGMEQVVRNLIAQGLPPSAVAQKVFEAVRDGQFYILPHPEMKRLTQTRMEDILEERNPTYTPLI
jgi:NAD(P)-dependent dehydrogenase (short-subunit alcohol dehydrogenase family)